MVREISPAADQSRTFKVKVALREGNSAHSIGAKCAGISNSPSTIRVFCMCRYLACRQHGQQAYVLVFNQIQLYVKVPVTLGDYGRDSVPVLSGLQPQDYVVMGGGVIYSANDKKFDRLTVYDQASEESKAVRIQRTER